MSQINLEFYLDEAITQIKKQQRKNIRYAPKAKLEKKFPNNKKVGAPGGCPT